MSPSLQTIERQPGGRGDYGSVITRARGIARPVEGDPVEARKHLVLQVDAVDGEIGVDQDVSNQHPVAVKLPELQRHRVVVPGDDFDVSATA